MNGDRPARPLQTARKSAANFSQARTQPTWEAYLEWLNRNDTRPIMREMPWTRPNDAMKRRVNREE